VKTLAAGSNILDFHYPSSQAEETEEPTTQPTKEGGESVKNIFLNTEEIMKHPGFAFKLQSCLITRESNHTSSIYKSGNKMRVVSTTSSHTPTLLEGRSNNSQNS
jgi:hypothetical protein